MTRRRLYGLLWWSRFSPLSTPRGGLLMVALVALAAFAAGPDRAAGQSFTIVADGQPRAVIVLNDEPDAGEKQATFELIDHVKAISGADLEVIRASSASGRTLAGRKPIYIGRSAGEKVQALAKRAGDDPAAFALVVTQQQVAMSGAGDEGVVNAALELIEQLGVRWFMPGELGTVIPQAKTLTLPVQQTAEAPSFALRGIGNVDRTWARRMRLGGEGPPSTLSMPSVGSFEEHPERYALVGGLRRPGQLCLTNEQTFAAVVEHVREYFRSKPAAQWIAMGSHGGGHCECANCRALDPAEPFGPFTGGINVSDRYVWFLNRVLEAVHDDLPTKRIGLTVATPHIGPPVEQVGHPNLDVLGWVNAYCRIHGVNNPSCPERMMVLRQTQQWVKQLQGGYYERTNWGNIAGPGLLFPAVHRFRQDMPAYHEAGVAGVRGAAYGHWISENPSDYIGAKLLWDHEADVDALLTDFYMRYYGPAAGPMSRYHQLIEQAARDADYHTGTALDAANIFTTPIRREATQLVVEARSLTENDVYRRRVDAVGLALAYLDSFALMLEHRNKHDYLNARDAMQRAEAARDQLIKGYKPPLLNPNFAPNYFRLFFGRIIEEAAARVTQPNRFVAGLDDRWQFMLDPQNVGHQLQWWRPEIAGGNWQTIRAYTTSWSNQGLRYYEGVAWYRQEVTLPAEISGRVMLWFGAVDEHATVWLNGELLGESHRDVFKPFEFDATEAVKPGESNEVVVRVENLTVNEVGTGGLLAPVMFYSQPAE